MILGFCASGCGPGPPTVSSTSPPPTSHFREDKDMDQLWGKQFSQAVPYGTSRGRQTPHPSSSRSQGKAGVAGLTGVKHASVGASLGPSLMTGPIGERGQGRYPRVCFVDVKMGRGFQGHRGRMGKGLKPGWLQSQLAYFYDLGQVVQFGP